MSVLESEKRPLENRVWYNYAGQPYQNELGTSSQPSLSARVLDDGTTQLRSFLYDSVGNITNSVDPLGRSTSYVYSTNLVDLLEIHQTTGINNDLLAKFTYNTVHRPVTVTDASGQSTTNTYNGRGQLLTTVDPLGETNAFNYNANGYLLTVVGPLPGTNDTVSFSYDSVGRVHTVTGVDGYTLNYSYDNFDRVTNVTYPDGTFEALTYSNLDLVVSQDRLGRQTVYTYDALRQRIAVQDPLNRVTRFEYCGCGAMSGLIDPMGRRTSWEYDVEGRKVAKQYADGSRVLYSYENTTSRLHSRFDEKGQETDYQYYIDNDLESVNYPNATVSTPTVTYTYDPNYNRVLTMQDGIGTTTYSYNPITAPPALGAGRLASVSGPLPSSTVTYQYDQLERVVNRAINGVPQAVTYDVLWRPNVVTNALGAFQYSYVGGTARLASEAYPNGQTNLYTYYNNLGDDRLQQIQHLYPNGTFLSGFGYAYNPVGDITAWSNRWDTIPTRVWLPSYDAADQLTNVASTGGTSTVTNYMYAYNPAGNRLLGTTNGVQSTFSYNALNQLLSGSTGSTNAPTYQWDAENRLTAINQGVNSSEFNYDGLGRRVEIVEKTNGVVQTANYYLWCGTSICEQRDSTGSNVLRRLFPQGEVLVGGIITNYFYTRDHLGSVREALNSSGLLMTRYDYDPYGQRSVLQQNYQTIFGFTGDFVHQKSGLYLTWFRALDGTSGRWLSRDPLGESVNVNLYSYVGNNPVRYTDWFGLCDTGNENGTGNGNDNGNGNGDYSTPASQVPPGPSDVVGAAAGGLADIAGDVAEDLGEFLGYAGTFFGAFQAANDNLNNIQNAFSQSKPSLSQQMQNEKQREISWSRQDMSKVN
jgi:RHS repeat-associated protein